MKSLSLSSWWRKGHTEWWEKSLLILDGKQNRCKFFFNLHSDCYSRLWAVSWRLCIVSSSTLLSVWPLTAIKISVSSRSELRRSALMSLLFFLIRLVKIMQVIDDSSCFLIPLSFLMICKFKATHSFVRLVQRHALYLTVSNCSLSF